MMGGGGELVPIAACGRGRGRSWQMGERVVVNEKTKDRLLTCTSSGVIDLYHESSEEGMVQLRYLFPGRG